MRLNEMVLFTISFFLFSCNFNGDLKVEVTYPQNDSYVCITNKENTYLRDIHVELDHDYKLSLEDEVIPPYGYVILSTDRFINKSGRRFNPEVHVLNKIWVDAMVGGKGQTTEYKWNSFKAH
jgi:hypothetical protein